MVIRYYLSLDIIIYGRIKAIDGKYKGNPKTFCPYSVGRGFH